MNVFPDFLPLNMLTVLPNSNNQVVIPLTPQCDLNHQSIEDGFSNYRNLEGTVRALNCCFGIRCSSMEMKIVKYAKHVLDVKERDLKELEEKAVMQNRIINIESRISDMHSKLQALLDKLDEQTEYECEF